MADDRAGEKGWKDNLLKSSLPLEQVVSDMLMDISFSVMGEYAYTRPNEQGISTEFSVDILAGKLITDDKNYWGSLSALIECKYSHQGATWVFSPIPKQSAVYGDCISYNDALGITRLVDDMPLQCFEETLPRAIRGIEMHAKGFGLNAISHGLNQLRYALPNVMAQESGYIVQSTHATRGKDIRWLCPILVTTTNLLILREGLSLGDYYAASNLEDVTQAVNALIVQQYCGPQLREYSAQIVNTLIQERPDIRQRLQDAHDLEPALSLDTLWLHRDAEGFAEDINREYSSIIVVKLDALQDLLKSIIQVIEEAGQSVRIAARLIEDETHRTGRVVPVDEQ